MNNDERMLLIKAGKEVRYGVFSEKEYYFLTGNTVSESIDITTINTNDVASNHIVYVDKHGFVNNSYPERMSEYADWKKQFRTEFTAIVSKVYDCLQYQYDFEYNQVCDMLRDGDTSIYDIIKNIQIPDSVGDIVELKTSLADYFISMYNEIFDINPEMKSKYAHIPDELKIISSENDISNIAKVLKQALEKLNVKIDILLGKADMLVAKYDYIVSGIYNNVNKNQENILETVEDISILEEYEETDDIKSELDEIKADNEVLADIRKDDDIDDTTARLAESIIDVLDDYTDDMDRIRNINQAAKEINNDEIEKYVLRLNEILVSQQLSNDRYKHIESLINELTLHGITIPDVNEPLKEKIAVSDEQKSIHILTSASSFMNWINRIDIDSRIKNAVENLEFIIEEATQRQDVDIVVDSNDVLGFRNNSTGDVQYCVVNDDKLNMSLFIITLNELVGDQSSQMLIKESYDTVKSVEREQKNKNKPSRII